MSQLFLLILFRTTQQERPQIHSRWQLVELLGYRRSLKAGYMVFLLTLQAFVERGKTSPNGIRLDRGETLGKLRAPIECGGMS